MRPPAAGAVARRVAPATTGPQLKRDPLGGTHMSFGRTVPRLICPLPSVLLGVILNACGGATHPVSTGGPLFEILACRGSAQAPNGELFHVRILDPTVVAQATSRIGKGQGLIIVGQAEDGDGGFNQPWNWHLDPTSIHFAEATVEVCDGCPSWVKAGAQYCPWSTEVLRRTE